MTDKRILIELTDVDTFQRLPEKYIDNGDGTFSQAVSNGTIKNVVADPSSNSELLSKFDNFDQVHPSAFVTYKRTSNGQSILAVSADPLTPGVESSVVINQKAKTACELEVEYSINRVRHQFGSICLFANKPTGPDPVVAPINITSIYQSSAVNGAANTAVAGTVVTIVLESPLPGAGSNNCVYLSDWVHVDGIVDSRLNYQNLTISYISTDRKTITCGYSDDTVLGSTLLSATPTLGTAKLYFYNNASGASDAAAIRFSSATATSAALVTLFNGGDVQISGSLLASHLTTMATTAPVYSTGIDGNLDIAASSRFLLSCGHDSTLFADKARDSAVSWATRLVRTGVKPSNSVYLQPRFRIYSPQGMARPVAKIISATKTGTTTATVTTAGAHGLVTGNYVTCKGSRDGTNWGNMGTPTVITVLNATQFTVVWGLAVTATIYGGSVHLNNGSIDQSNVLGQGITQASIDSNGWLNLTGGVAWTGISIGDYVNVYGCRDGNTGANLGVDGVWELAGTGSSGTILKFTPVYDVFGTRVSPDVTLGTTTAAGSVILRVTSRLHDSRFRDISSEVQVKIDGQGTIRPDKALPVFIAVTPTVNQGSPATISSSGTGAWFITPAIAGITDQSSSALTTTGTLSSIANNLGNGFQVNVAVTAVTGTAPSLDVRIEESYDGGTNWVTLYDMQRITATGSYNTPILRASGRHIRYVRTISGTTPSITCSINRTVLPFIQAEPQKRIIDRSISLTTLNSTTPTLFAGAANNVQLVINIGSATTPPVLQLQGSEDGINFYDIGTSLSAVATITVQYTLVSTSCTFVRARVSTAGATVVAGYVSLKAWS